MIYYTIPYSLNKNIGKAYNDEMKRIPNDDDWVCFRDADTQFLTPNYGHQLQEIVDQHPDTGLFTCYTNRVGNASQCYNSLISEDPNILNHRAIALQLQAEKRLDVKDLFSKVSGMLMLFKKSTWKEVGGFMEEDGKMLTIDESFSLKVLEANQRILLMEGVYIFHFYRLDSFPSNTSHLE